MRQRLKNDNLNKFKILILDDESTIVDGIIGNLDQDEFHADGETNPMTAIERFMRNDYDLLITDYQMTPINGDQVVEMIRKFNSTAYILLLTGFAESAPPREMFSRLDIQGYCEKGNFSQLFLWIESARKVMTANRQIYEIKDKLKQLINFAPTLYKMQPPYDALTLMIEETSILFGAKDVFILVDDIINMKYGNKNLFKGTGKFDITFEEFIEKHGDLFNEVAKARIFKVETTVENGIIIPFSNNHFQNLGVLYLERSNFNNNSELLEIFSNQLASSLENIFLYQLSVTDELTGLYNRIFINNYLMKYVFENISQKTSVIIADIDDFKHVNDSYGHQNGDIVLRTVAHTIRDTLRQKDIIARFGGEEFIIILPETELENSKFAAEKIRNNIEKKIISISSSMDSDIGNKSISVTISLGISQLIRGDTWTNLIGRADIALYEAKKLGKNRFCINDGKNND